MDPSLSLLLEERKKSAHGLLCCWLYLGDPHKGLDPLGSVEGVQGVHVVWVAALELEVRSLGTERGRGKGVEGAEIFFMEAEQREIC